jgi:hypothetical protein
MKALRGSVLVALVLISALVVIASPAFATPNLTASSGNTAVAPFITPQTNTRSLYTGSATNSSLSIAGVDTISCTTSRVSGYASTTHTQVRLTDLTFGTGGSCRAGLGTVVSPISCLADSRTPWFLHVSSIVSGGGARGSATGTVSITTTCTVLIRTLFGDQRVVVDSGQSCRNPAGGGVTYTWDTGTRRSQLVVNCDLIVTLRGVRNESRTATFTGTYDVRPDTARDATLSVTAAS